MSYIENYCAGAEDSLRAQLATSAIAKGEEQLPFMSSREGERINIVVPLTLNRGDTLGELIILIASKLPTAVLLQGHTGWVEPEWTSESSRHLHGIISAIQGPPESLRSSTSPVDLARLAVWVSSCNAALSVPGGAAGTVGSVLPTSVGGAKSASKYIARVFGSLRATSSEPMHQAAIKTLEQVLKLWYKENRDEALALVRKNKIAWGTVLTAGSPTTTKKVKGKVITLIKSPSKPSKSPFVSGREKQEISAILKAVWNKPEEYRQEWNALTSEEQHHQYKAYIVKLKQHYDDLTRISTTLHAKLGHRKKWVHAVCRDADAVPQKKKDKSNEYVWTANFFKTDLQRVQPSVKLVFAPSHYLTDVKYGTEVTLATLFERFRDTQQDIIVTPQMCEDDNVRALWQEWINRFHFRFNTPRSEIPDAISITDDNPFTVLAEAQEVPNVST